MKRLKMQEKYKKLHLPLKKKDASALKAGGFVKLSGKLTVARDQTLKKMFKDGKTARLEKSVLYYCGPVIKGGKVIAAGPTTSSRMDRMAASLVSAGVAAIIGKGKISSEAAKALKGKVIYFEAPGGAGALLASKIKDHRITGYSSLGVQALREFSVEDFPALTAFDLEGKSIWKK